MVSQLICDAFLFLTPPKRRQFRQISRSGSLLTGFCLFLFLPPFGHKPPPPSVRPPFVSFLSGSFLLVFSRGDALFYLVSSSCVRAFFFSLVIFSIYSLLPSFPFSPELLISRPRFGPPDPRRLTLPPCLGQILCLLAVSAPSLFRFPRRCTSFLFAIAVGTNGSARGLAGIAPPLSSTRRWLTRSHQLRPDSVVPPPTPLSSNLSS